MLSIYSMIYRIIRTALALTLAAGLFVLGGCSAGDVQFEGKIFEAVGLNGQQARSADPKVKERAPLVLPPKADLPAPGKRVAAGDDTLWPDDPDLARKRQISLAEKERQKYCTEVGRNEYDPAYDEDKAKQCSTLLSKAFNNAFGRAPEPEDN